MFFPLHSFLIQGVAYQVAAQYISEKSEPRAQATLNLTQLLPQRVPDLGSGLCIQVAVISREKAASALREDQTRCCGASEGGEQFLSAWGQKRPGVGVRRTRWLPEGSGGGGGQLP